MCGIAGIITGNAQNYSSEIRKMTAAIYHRGPDAQGIYIDNMSAMGHRRLSIVDLSETGAQPMISYDSNEVLVFNGEIYGFESIKKDLCSYPFKGKSDTEVILALYKKYGIKLLKELPGMFSFALWNKTKKELFCARDRFGEKPFYYAIGQNNEFIFSSEIKSILASGLIKPEIDLTSISFYLKHLYIPPNKTIYKNIHTLPAAHSLIFKGGKIHIERYWNLPPVNNKINLEDAIGIFNEKLDGAVRKQLVSDVPIGAFLSGGLDSSTIVAIAAKHKKQLNTFSFGFGNSINELPYAKEIAKKYETNHIELNADDTQIDKLLIEMASIYDEPFADSSNIPTYLISKLTKEHVTVAITGDGGDELCGGYGCYSRENELSNQTTWPKALASIFKIGELISNKTGNYKLGGRFNLIHGASVYSNVMDYHSNEVNTYFSDKEIEALGLPAIESFPYSFEFDNTIDSTMKMDIENYMAGDILVKIDRASMANSLELRSPFLDVDFASFCIQLPHRLKIKNNTEKLILREACGHMWTENIRKRKKQGFGAPVKEWLNINRVQSLSSEHLNSKNNKLFDILDFQNCEKYVGKNNYKKWILLNLALWKKNN